MADVILMVVHTGVSCSSAQVFSPSFPVFSSCFRASVSSGFEDRNGILSGMVLPVLVYPLFDPIIWNG